MRCTLIVLDSLGVGAMPDAADWGDAGADTLGHILSTVKDIQLPNLTAMGLGGAYDGGDVAQDEVVVATFEGADVHDHVDLHRAELHGLAGLGGFGLGDRRAQGEAEDTDRHHAGALEQAGEAGLAAARGVERALAHQAVHAGFGAQVAEGIVAFHLQRGADVV